MKKLISAAAAMAMAASMVSSAVPFATGAADADKGLYFDIITNRDGKTKASTTISKDDIAAGDVTIPVGLFMKESEKNTKTIKAEWTVTTKDGDASDVAFTLCPFTSAYYTDNVDTKIGDQTVSSKNLIGFSGKVTKSAKGAKWSMLGDNVSACLDKYDEIGLADAYGSVAWTAHPELGYEYTGTTSDEFPVFVFEVTFPKGTKAGTYTIDFLNYLDAKNSDVPSTMIEAGKTGSSVRISPDSGLQEDGISFTIEGDVTPPTTTTTTPPKTTTAPADTTKPSGSTTTTINYETKDDFTIQPDAVTAKPGDLIEFIPVRIDSNGRKAATLVFELPTDLPKGWEVEVPDLTCYCMDGFEPQFKKLAETYNAPVFDPSDKNHPAPIVDGEPMVYINIKVPEDAAPGDYEYFFSRFHIVESTTSTSAVAYNGKVLPGKITIEGDAPQTTATTKPVGTTTKTPDTTKAPAQTTTTAKPGTPLYGDASDDGEVNIADVVVLNKWLHNNEDYAMTDQGKLNANCCDVSAGKINAEDSDAIIKSLVSLVKLPCAASDLK